MLCTLILVSIQTTVGFRRTHTSKLGVGKGHITFNGHTTIISIVNGHMTIVLIVNGHTTIVPIVNGHTTIIPMSSGPNMNDCMTIKGEAK